MKNNWLGVLLGVSCAFFSSFAFSLGLGSITSDSAINEPLIAEIELINVGDLENTQILVGIGTDSDYELASVTREFFHSDLQFEVQAEGVGQPRILVRTRQPLQDPYLNFIVQVRWPQGKLLREYTLLLDMPVFSKQEASNSAPLQSAASAPTTARQAAVQQAQQTNRQTTTSAVQPSRVRSTSNLNTGQAYRVSAGDTLWALAGDVASSTGTSRHQAMLSLHEQNPNAFVNGDINRLRADAELRVPSEAQMSSRTEGQAVRDFSSLAQDGSASPIQSATNSINRSTGSGDSAQGGRLALTSTSGSNSVSGSNSSTDVAAQQAANDELSSENATLKEQLDASEIERQELQDRLANLEEQLSLLEEERVLQIENEDLAAVQQAVTAIDDAEDQAEAPVVAAPEPQPETLMDKLNAFRYWIFGGLAIILVIALLVVLLVLKQRKSSEVDELYYDDEQDADDLDEDEGYLNAEEGDEEFDEGIDEITKDLSEESDEDEFEEGLEEADLEGEDLENEDVEDESAAEDEEEPLFAASFDEAEEEGEEAFESDEFEDLDEFFSDESSGATDVLFGNDDDEEESVESDEDELDVGAEESSSDVEEDTLDFSVEDLNIPEQGVEEEAPETEEENSLEFEIGDMDFGDQDAEPESKEIDLEDKFDYVESGITEDLGADAEADFEESIEVHSSDMNELLVPSDEDGSDEDELFIGESPEAAGEDLDADDNFVEDVEEDLDSLLDEDGQDQDEGSDDSLLDVDDDLNLDEDMDADLDDLDLGEDDLDVGDSDEEFLTKLELAEAYLEMGDAHGAKELLSEVEKDGNAEQQAAAKSMLEGIKD